MRFGVVTLFPEMFAAVTDFGVSGRAFREGLAFLETVSPRDFTSDRHRTVDDRPYGGGQGMLMLADPLLQATRQLQGGEEFTVGGRRPKTVYFSPRGRRMTHQLIAENATAGSLVMVCGRYEGVDQRFIDLAVDEEWSMGDFVVSGGEYAALAAIDAITRLLPGALGHQNSAVDDSFVNGLLEGPQYTRPEVFEGVQVPEVLLSGDHARILAWRKAKSLELTRRLRPDLLD